MRIAICVLTALTVLVPAFARAAEPRWFPGDMHTHSVHSWDAAGLGGDSVARCLRLSVKQGLEFTSITDHQSVAAQADPEFVSSALTPIPGEEWGIMGHAGIHGTMTAVPEVDTKLPPTTWNDQVERALTLTRARGSVVVINHPPHPEIIWAWTTSTFDAVEVWNAGWMFPFIKPTPRAVADALLKERGLAEVPGAMSRELAVALDVKTGGFNAQSVRFWEAHLERGAHAAAVGGGDRHILIAPGYPTTWISAEDRKVGTLLDAVRAGRTCVTRSPLVRPAELSARSGGAVALPGDVVRSGHSVSLKVRAQVSGNAQVVFYRGREAFATERIDAAHPEATATDVPRGVTWYRAEVLEPILDLGLSPADQAIWDTLTNTLSSSQPEDVLAFMSRFGEKLEDEGRLPSFRIGDKVNRVINADPTHRGWCKSVLTSPIYVR